MYRWIVKHRRLVMMLWVLPISIIYFFMFYYTGMSLAYWALFVACMTFTAWGFVHSCSFRLSFKAIKSLNDDCDPYPLLDIVNEKLSYTRSKTRIRVLLMHKALALREIGEFESNLEILENIDLDQPTSSPIFKLLYYINLSDANINLDKINEAELMLSKAYQILQDTKLSKRSKLILERYYKFNHFAIQFISGNSDGMEEFLLEMNKVTSTKRFLISVKLATAAFYLKDGQVNKAKEYLQFVIDNGNKLHDTVKAQKLMTDTGEQVEKNY